MECCSSFFTASTVLGPVARLQNSACVDWVVIIAEEQSFSAVWQIRCWHWNLRQMWQKADSLQAKNIYIYAETEKRLKL